MYPLSEIKSSFFSFF